jgi:hypothetical protein
MKNFCLHPSSFILQPSREEVLSSERGGSVTAGSTSSVFIQPSTKEISSMRLFKSQRGAELSEIVAGLLVVLVAGVAATSVMFNGLDTAAGKVATWLGGLTIPAP